MAIEVRAKAKGGKVFAIVKVNTEDEGYAEVKKAFPLADLPAGVCRGWSYSGGTYTAPPGPTPAELAAEKEARLDAALGPRAGLAGVVLVLLDEINVLRTQARLPVRTIPWLRSAAKSKMID